MSPLVKAALLLGGAIFPAGEAFACSALTEDYIIRLSDIVVDGTATCNLARGSCLIRASSVIKDDSWHGDESRRLFRFHFEPGANARIEREAQETGRVPWCGWPWEPEANPVVGRFYLHRERGRLVPRDESTRGAKVDEEGAQ